MSASALQKQEGVVMGENWHFHCLHYVKHGSLGITLDASVMEVHLGLLILKPDFSVDWSEENAPDHLQICQVRHKEVKIPSDQSNNRAVSRDRPSITLRSLGSRCARSLAIDRKLDRIDSISRS